MYEGLFQVCFFKPGTNLSGPKEEDVVEDLDEMVKALMGSPYELDREQTVRNDGVAMIVVKTNAEAGRLMDLGQVVLPSGYVMEIPMP